MNVNALTLTFRRDSIQRARKRACFYAGVAYRTLRSPRDITTATIIHRIVSNRAAYEARNAKKNKSEAAYYQSKQHVTEM